MSSFISTVNDFLRHQTEGDHSQKSDSILLKQTTRHPLIDNVSDVLDQFFNTGFILTGSPLDGFEEEEVERLKRVLVHVTNVVQRNNQEVQKGTFIRYWSIDFSL